MALQSIININVDFYDKKYILINSKQYDRNSRFLTVTCYNHGDLFLIDKNNHSAYVRYKKSDNNSVFNSCNIDSGKIIVELTEQMLASSGVCYADLVIVNKGNAVVDNNTGEITTINNGSVLSTMTFCIDVSESAIENSNIESSYEYHGLSELLIKAEANYESVMKNAKASEESAIASANSASVSASNAKISEDKAKVSETNAKTSESNAKISESNASSSANSASASASNASSSETSARGYATTAQNSMNSAVNSASSASTSASNAYNYYLQTEAITNGLNGAFLPMGTIAFAKLSELKESDVISAGYLYNISDNFITDDTFKVGAGVEYTAGTNVYYTADGYWDCLAGATVTGVKGFNEAAYRKGNVELTAENIGAIPSMDIATIDEVKNYLGI